MRAAALLVMLGACSFDFGFDGTRYRCGADGRCPPGQVCVAGVCEASPDASGDGGGDPDGGMTIACGDLTLLQDTFDTAGTGPYWNSFADSGATIAESGGQLVIDLNSNADAYAGYMSTYFYDLHGGAIETSVAEVLGSNTILEVRNHLGNVAQLVHQEGEIQAVTHNAPGAGTHASRAWLAAEQYWRIREDAGDLVWEVSTDRASWSELHREPLPWDVSHVRGVVAGGGAAVSPSRARFDDVNPGAPASPYCPLAQLQDDFAAAPLGPLWEPYSEAGCTITETGGDLALTYTSGTGNVFCGMTSLHVWDLATGDGIVVDSMGLPTIPSFVTYVQLAVPGTGGLTRVETTLDDTSFEFRLYVNDTITDSRSMTLDRTMHRYWRMRGESQTAIFETSPDRAAWTERWRIDAPFALTPVEVNIGAGHYDTIAVPLTVTLPGINAD